MTHMLGTQNCTKDLMTQPQRLQNDDFYDRNGEKVVEKGFVLEIRDGGAHVSCSVTN